MITIPGPTWHKHKPIAASDTVDNIGGATAVLNRSASNVLASITMGDGSTGTFPVPAFGSLGRGGRWQRVNATGTSNGGATTGAYETIHVSSVGGAFGNQPANDGIEVVSSDAADTTQTLTLYGTTQGTDTVVVETVTLNGTTQVATTKTDWGVLLGAVLSAVAAGTVTIREASGNATITTITTGNLRKGVEAITTSYPTNAPTLVASGATTKQFGLYGTSLAGAAQGDSQALTGTTAVAMNSAFGTETLVLFGDVENTVTVTVSVSSDLIAVY